MQSKKTFAILILLLLLLLSGVVGFLFRSDLQNILGLQPNTVYKKDFRGENIVFNAGQRVVSIPPNFSQNALNYLKQEMTETGGLPLKLEGKGNPLPFGIP